MEDKSKITERIRALLRLGESGNQHEAEAALRQATKLMMQHEISELEIRAARPPEAQEKLHMGHAPIYTAGKKSAWRTCLASAIAFEHGCRTVNYSGGGSYTLAIFGRDSDVATVRQFFAWLVVQGERLAAKQKAPIEWISTKKHRADWLFGFAAGVSEQLKQVKKEVRKEVTSTALVLVDNHAAKVEEAWKEHMKDQKIKQGRPRTTHITSAFHDGKLAGKSVHLGKVLPEGKSTKALTG